MIVPYVAWKRYGDLAIVEENFDAIERYMALTAKNKFDSPYGRIESAWEYAHDGTLVWRFTVPPNSTATVHVPNGDINDCKSGDLFYNLGICRLTGTTGMAQCRVPVCQIEKTLCK